MNPKDFCSLPGYDHTLICCFNFDPLFFERIVYPALQSGGNDRILILADKGAVESSASQWQGQAHLLGRAYKLVLPAADGAFHPKIMLRLGDEGGAVWIGSGNLSSGGWGCNDEIGVHWTLGPDQMDDGGWVMALLSRLEAWCGDDDLAIEFLHRMQSLQWWPETAEPGAILWQGPGLPSLASQLSERWAGRRFESLWLTTGSSDKRGAFLKWARDTFGIQKATIATDPSWVDFEPAALDELGMDITIQPAPSMHAKFYHFRGPEGDAAVLGSANCSAAAWFGHNTECMLIYDAPSSNTFEEILARETEGVKPSEVLPNRHAKGQIVGTDSMTGALWNLEWARYEDVNEQIVFSLSPVPPEHAVVQLDIEGTLLAALTRTHAGDNTFVVDVEGLTLQMVRTLFCSAFVDVDGAKTRTNIRWVDDITRLHRTTRHRTTAAFLDQLWRCEEDRERNRIIDELQGLADALLDGKTQYSESMLGRVPVGLNEPEQNEVSAAPALNPDDMIAVLGDRVDGNIVFPSGPTQSASLPLLGVMNLLFGKEGRIDNDREAPNEESEYEEGVVLQVRSPRYNPPSSDVVANLHRQMDRYISRFKQKDLPGNPAEFQWVNRMTPSDLVSACAYPLAVTALGLEHGWLDGSQARGWVTDLFDMLFYHQQTKASHKGTGALTRFRRRFESSGSLEAFDSVVGNGSLLMTCACALAALPQTHDSGVDAMHDLMSWRALWQSQALRARTDTVRLRKLLERLRVERAKTVLRFKGPKAYDAIKLLSQWVEEHGQHVCEVQKHRLKQGRLEQGYLWTRGPQGLHTKYRPGDPLWGPKSGWGVVIGPSAKAGRFMVHRYLSARSIEIEPERGAYLNLAWESLENTELKQLLHDAELQTH